MKTLSNVIAYPATYEDLLFLNKNKQYGAYVLRKTYKKHITIACIISVILFSFSISTPLIFRNNSNDIITPVGTIGRTIELIAPPPSIGQEKQMEKIQIPVSINTVKFTIPKVVIDEKYVETYIPTIKELENAHPWTSTQKGQTGGIDITLTEPVNIPENNVVDPVNNQLPHTWAEVMPSYPGGNEELLAFFAREINYPEIARKVGIEGKVFLSFVVEKDGSITNAVVERGIEGGCKEEALRVLLLLGKWRPGMQNGVPVRVKMVLPVLFSLR